MADGNFERCLRRVLGSEGRYSNHPADPGGATMWGITFRDYGAWRRLKGQPPRDVRLITLDERNEIYRKKYWNGARCDELPDGLDYCVFDGAVNSGVAQSVKWLQRALGVKDDGDIGDHTLLAAHDADPHEVIASICRQRRAFMRKLKTFPTFGNGWIKRVDRVEQVASAMAIPSLQDDHIPHHAAPSGCAKARTEDVAPPPVNPTTATATTATVSAGAATVQTIQEQLAPFSETLSVMKYVLLACAVIGVGFTLYSLWTNSKLKEAI